MKTFKYTHRSFTICFAIMIIGMCCCVSTKQMQQRTFQYWYLNERGDTLYMSDVNKFHLMEEVKK
jgi:hypothetical protein